MSDTNTTETTTADTTNTTEKAKRASVKLTTVRELAAKLGLEPRELKAYVHYGHKGGVSVAVSQTEDVSRVFVYKAVPAGEAVVAFTEEQRKEYRLGNVFAEVDFEKGADLALVAIENALRLAAEAPAPVKAEAKPKAEKKPRAKKTETAATEATSTDEQPTA